MSRQGNHTLKTRQRPLSIIADVQPDSFTLANPQPALYRVHKNFLARPGEASIFPGLIAKRGIRGFYGFIRSLEIFFCDTDDQVDLDSYF
jgi:hypothetical protein